MILLPIRSPQAPFVPNFPYSLALLGRSNPCLLFSKYFLKLLSLLSSQWIRSLGIHRLPDCQIALLHTGHALPTSSKNSGTQSCMHYNPPVQILYHFSHFWDRLQSPLDWYLAHGDVYEVVLLTNIASLLLIFVFFPFNPGAGWIPCSRSFPWSCCFFPLLEKPYS